LFPVLFFATVLSGCGPSATELREKTLSTLNSEADRWGGGQQFVATASDAYGRPLALSLKKTTLDYVLEIRSFGPDGLPKNSDDLVVTRSHRHGETTLAVEAEKAVEGLGRGAASGVFQGVKKGLGFGKEDEKAE
jgi:hypothetical protein